MWSPILLLLFVLVAVTVADDLPTNCGRFLNFKFFRGNKTEPDDYPWLALLEYDTPNGKLVSCGGVLISSRHILSAGHCVSAPNWKLSSVRLGEYDRSTEIDCLDDGGPPDNTIKNCLPKPRSVKVESWITPDKFEYGKPGYDIALIRLAEEVTFDEYVQPICLPDEQGTIVSQKFQVAGWGMLYNRPGYNMKLRSPVTYIDRTRCVDAYAQQNVTVKDDQICLGGRRREHVCFADSGGPLMGIKRTKDGVFRMTVFGVFAHYSAFCDAKGWPGIFTDVGPYRNWVVQHVTKG